MRLSSSQPSPSKRRSRSSKTPSKSKKPRKVAKNKKELSQSSKKSSTTTKHRHPNYSIIEKKPAYMTEVLQKNDIKRLLHL